MIKDVRFWRPAGPTWFALAIMLLGSTAYAAAAVPAAAAATTPHAIIDTTSKDLITLIDEARTYVDNGKERFYTAVTELLEPVIDFPAFARSVMAGHFRDATDAQRAQFAESFKNSLVRTYALALLEFNDGEIVVVPPEGPVRNPKRRSVKMEIRTSSGEVYPVLYSMALAKTGEWRIRNLIINGINIGLTYRNQFNGSMDKHNDDLDTVIASWAGEVASSEDAPQDKPVQTAGG